jgi:hypothetical protein
MHLLPKRHIPDDAEFKQNYVDFCARLAREQGKEPDFGVLASVAEQRWQQFKLFLIENPRYATYQVR